MSNTMTPKERWLAALHLQPVDRLPFWPKLNGSYARAQAAPFRDMDAHSIHQWIGSDEHIGIPGCVREQRSRTGLRQQRNGDTLRTHYTVPGHEMVMRQVFDVDSQSWHPVQFPVETRDDILAMTAWYEDISVELDEASLQQSRFRAAEIGQTALTTNGIGESPLMHWVEWVAGVENAHFLLADHPDETEALFAAMHRVLLEKTRVLCAHSPADVLYLVENTSTTLISPDQYRRYCYPHISAYAAITQAAERDLILHMCGHLEAVLPDLARIPAQAFEAFTSPTLGNTTLLDGRSHCPNTCLIGGTNAMLWTRPATDIIARLDTDLAALPHHRGIVVTSAGVMPPLCAPQTIKTVCDWVREYDARLVA
jgi:uroporphyrinogen-III decarboxylase